MLIIDLIHRSRDVKKGLKIKMKNYNFSLIMTTIVCLLPIILALIIYNDLPDRVVMQWDLQGNPNWSAPKAVAAFGIPVVFAIVNIITLLIIFNDPKRKNISDKLFAITIWILPLASLITVPLILFSAMEISLPINIIVFSFAGLIYILIGNYMPKCKQNYSVGIKIPWTLNDSENWNKTHRLGGFLWTIGGILFIIFGFLPLENNSWLIILLILIALLSFTPILYSYCLYKKNNSKESL